MPIRGEFSFNLFLARVDALYRTDLNGQLESTNEWDSRLPPRFHLMRTAEGPIFRWRADVPDNIVRALSALCDREPPDRAFETLPVHYDQYLEVLASHAPVAKVWSGPAYMSIRDTPPSLVPLNINEGNADLLCHYFKDWLPDVPHRQPFVALIKDGHAVSICASARISPSVHCAGVETHYAYRQKGYASNADAGWACAVRSQNAVPFYSTSWNNLSSQRIAERLGFALAGVDLHVT
jgi:GNAT acetyltransferase